MQKMFWDGSSGKLNLLQENPIYHNEAWKIGMSAATAIGGIDLST